MSLTNAGTHERDGAQPNRYVKLIQGYVWHPKSLDIVPYSYLPEALTPDILILLDKIPAPFTFFDDGTLAATQTLYQLTILHTLYVPHDLPLNDDDLAEVSSVVPWVAEQVQQALNTTPEGVGWQLMEDLREITF